MADGAVLGRDLGVRVLWGPSQDQDQSEVVLLPVGTRLWKEDAGVIPPGRAPRAAAAAGSSVVSAMPGTIGPHAHHSFITYYATTCYY